MLKNGVFWLHNALASQIVLNPFQIFIKDLVRISYSILELERVLPTIKSPPINVNDLDEDDKVVHQSPDGQLKVGFSEEAEQQQDGLQVWLRENPFDRMPGTSDRYITRQRGSINTVVPFRKLLLCAEDAKVQNVDEAILTLKRLADS